MAAAKQCGVQTEIFRNNFTLTQSVSDRFQYLLRTNYTSHFVYSNMKSVLVLILTENNASEAHQW